MTSIFPLADFHQHGIAILPQAFNDQEVMQLKQRAWALRRWAEDHLVDGLRRVNEHGRPNSEVPPSSGNTWGVNEITRRACFDPALINAICHGHLGDSVEALIDQPRAWGLKLLWAPRDFPYRLHWHRDCAWRYDHLLPFKPAAQDHLQYNVALARDEAFEVVPGSHRRALNGEERECLSHDRWAPLPGAVSITLSPGDVLVMDAHALHRGQAPAGSPRMSLHYSVQAQWVPLLPWGEAEHFRWINSDDFQQQLNPRCRQWYQRLSSAAPCSEQLAWLEAIARHQGWDGSWDTYSLSMDHSKEIYPQ